MNLAQAKQVLVSTHLTALTNVERPVSAELKSAPVWGSPPPCSICARPSRGPSISPWAW